jgi:hypothetical protein
MSVVELLATDRPSQVAVAAGFTLFVVGGVAVSQGSAVAGIFLLLGGFVAAMYVEYRNVES